MPTNYRQIFAMKAKREKQIEEACPGIPYASGIYIFYRDDPSGLRMAYCGQARSLKERCASHLAEYDHIGLSLKKRGFYSADNPYGWRLRYRCCPISELDEHEVATIRNLGNNGFQLYNLTAGSQGEGKRQIAEYKPQKGYRQGVDAGYRKASKEISHLFDLHLDVKTKSDKPNKNQEKALQKFSEFLEYHKRGEDE